MTQALVYLCTFGCRNHLLFSVVDLLANAFSFTERLCHLLLFSQCLHDVLVVRRSEHSLPVLNISLVRSTTFFLLFHHLWWFLLFFFFFLLLGTHTLDNVQVMASAACVHTNNTTLIIECWQNSSSTNQMINWLITLLSLYNNLIKMSTAPKAIQIVNLKQHIRCRQFQHDGYILWSRYTRNINVNRTHINFNCYVTLQRLLQYLKYLIFKLRAKCCFWNHIREIYDKPNATLFWNNAKIWNALFINHSSFPCQQNL